MTEFATLISPSVNDVCVKIENILETKKSLLESSNPGLCISYKKGMTNRYQASYIVTFILVDEECNEEENTIYLFIIQNRKDGTISISITSSENSGLNILYSNISKNPILSIVKYLGGIIDSTVNILKKAFETVNEDDLVKMMA